MQMTIRGYYKPSGYVYSIHQLPTQNLNAADEKNVVIVSGFLKMYFVYVVVFFRFKFWLKEGIGIRFVVCSVEIPFQFTLQYR